MPSDSALKPSYVGSSRLPKAAVVQLRPAFSHLTSNVSTKVATDIKPLSSLYFFFFKCSHFDLLSTRNGAVSRAPCVTIYPLLLVFIAQSDALQRLEMDFPPEQVSSSVRGS